MPQYRLQTVLEMRERAEQAAKEELAKALQALAEAQKKQAEMEEDLARRKRERAEKVSEYLQQALRRGSGANAMQGMNRYEERLRDEEAALAEEIERQRAVVADRQAESEQRRAEFAEATKEKKAVEKHKEKWEKGVRAERAMREEQNQEEIGNALFLARKKDDQRRGGG
jgi:flagellar export protein FliJ